MKNIFKAFRTVKFDSDRRSHDVILAARHAARQAAINPKAMKWTIPGESVSWPPPR